MNLTFYGKYPITQKPCFSVVIQTIILLKPLLWNLFYHMT